jgi:hypothetical protein
MKKTKLRIRQLTLATFPDTCNMLAPHHSEERADHALHSITRNISMGMEPMISSSSRWCRVPNFKWWGRFQRRQILVSSRIRAFRTGILSQMTKYPCRIPQFLINISFLDEGFTLSCAVYRGFVTCCGVDQPSFCFPQLSGTVEAKQSMGHGSDGASVVNKQDVSVGLGWAPGSELQSRVGCWSYGDWEVSVSLLLALSYQGAHDDARVRRWAFPITSNPKMPVVSGA